MASRSGMTALLICGALLAGGTAPANASQVPDSHCDSWTQFAPDSPAWAQTFTAEHTGPLTKARFYVTTNTVVTLEVSIHAVNDSGFPTGPALATTTVADLPVKPPPPNVPGLPASSAVEASFAPGAAVVAGDPYALTVKRVAPAGNLSILVASPGAPEGPCPGVMFKDGDLDGTWESYGALAWANQYDMTMAVFVGDPETTEPPPSGGGGDGTPAPPPPTPPQPQLPPKRDPTVKITGTSLFFVNGQTCQVTTRVSASGKVTVSVYGKPPAGAAAKRKRPLLGRKTVRVNKAGKVTLKVPISKAARKTIASKGKLGATMEVKFTPADGGKPVTKRKAIKLKNRS